MLLSEIVLNGRVHQKHDSEANWNQQTSFVPYDGEIIVYDADAAHPLPRIKIGNGTSQQSALPFIVSLPQTSSADNGKVLRVVGGAWEAVYLPSASGVSF